MALQGRLALHEKLCEILGSRNVYFRPPDGTKMRYPCIVYERINANTTYADNDPYTVYDRYSVTVIDEDPDSVIVEKMGKFPLTSFDRHFYSGNLNHDVFTVFHI